MAFARIIQISEDFWNIRGPFNIFGVVNIGTQSSLVRLASGKFVLLDALALDADALAQVMALTDAGKALEAIVHLHPFHTVHVRALAAQFPEARLYGTERHVRRAPELNWQPERTEDAAFHALYADDFEFSVPRGVELIPKNENLHFASVLAFHRSSKTLHVDDTLTWIALPVVRRLVFHPTLASVLCREAGAADAFQAWGEALVERCRTVQHLCTAHGPKLPPKGAEIGPMVQGAFARTAGTVAKHKRKFG